MEPFERGEQVCVEWTFIARNIYNTLDARNPVVSNVSRDIIHGTTDQMELGDATRIR
jgi:hypothetical protein